MLQLWLWNLICHFTAQPWVWVYFMRVIKGSAVAATSTAYGRAVQRKRWKCSSLATLELITRKPNNLKVTMVGKLNRQLQSAKHRSRAKLSARFRIKLLFGEFLLNFVFHLTHLQLYSEVRDTPEISRLSDLKTSKRSCDVEANFYLTMLVRDGFLNLQLPSVHLAKARVLLEGFPIC